jgi:hypothetical protein
MRLALIVLSAGSLCACASVDTTPSARMGTDALTESKGMRAKARFSVDGPAVRAAKTVSIEPSRIAPEASGLISERQVAVLSQTLNQALCRRLSRRFTVVPAGQPADLTLRTEIVRLQTTGSGSAAVSTVAGFVSPIPFTPRLPIGLGSLVVEGAAADAQGQQRARLVWGRGADMFTTNARASTIGDAFTLARAFGDDFAKLLIQGSDPFKSRTGEDRPRRKAADEECAAWGEGPGAAGFLGERLGLPPEMTSKPAPAPTAAPRH